MRVPDFTKKGWQKQEALDMFNSRAGGSYGFACAFAALASQAGYKATVVAGRVSSKETSTDDGGDGMVPHCWVIIDDKYYDPEAHYRGWWKDVYGYTTYSIAHTDQYTAKM